MIAVLFIALGILYLVVNVLAVLLRNYQAHQFFATKAPKLPVVPNPSIIFGHILEITWPGKNWKIISELHDKYGKTFGFYMCEQPWVSTKDLDLIKLIEVDHAHRHINRSKFGLPFTEFNNSIFQVDDDDWRRVRRAISPALTNHKIRSDEVSSDIRHVIDQLRGALDDRLAAAQRLSGDKSIILNVRDTFERYTLAVIFLITYKRDKVIDFHAEEDKWVTEMDGGARNISNPIIYWAIAFPFLRPFLTFLIQFHKVGQMQARVVDYIVKATDINRVARELHAKVQRRMSQLTGERERSFSELKSQGTFKRRLVDTIIDAFLDKKIKYDDFVGSTLFLLLAGYETTADTISCLVWHLSQQPEIQDKMRKAITEEGIDAEYVMWCIQETVRWHPAVPLGTGRILGEDVTVNGLSLPKGTFVMPSTHSIHHDPDIWPEADKFMPERWRNASSFHPAAFMGFGLGPRNCVGGKLAVHEIKLVMQLLLTNYRIESCEETITHYEFSSPGLLFTLLDKPLKVRLVALA